MARFPNGGAALRGGLRRLTPSPWACVGPASTRAGTLAAPRAGRPRRRRRLWQLLAQGGLERGETGAGRRLDVEAPHSRVFFHRGEARLDSRPDGAEPILQGADDEIHLSGPLRFLDDFLDERGLD